MIVIESSPQAERLLARLHDSHRLYNLAENPTEEVRAEMARVMSAILAIELSANDYDRIIDVLMNFITHAEVELRRAVAERLSVVDNVPLRMVLQLANDEIEIADPVLRRSKVLMDMDLIYIVASKGAPYWRAIASRPNMSSPLINALANTNDLETALILAENHDIAFNEEVLDCFISMARTQQAIAQPLLRREEMTKEFALKLYEFVGDELKDYIKRAFTPDMVKNVEEKIDQAIQSLSENQRKEYKPTKDLIALAEDMMRRDMLTPDVMVKNLREGRVNNFVAMFSVYCALPISTIFEILKQDSGQGLAVACRALKISKSHFVNIYLMTAKMRTEKVINQNDLRRALNYFERIKSADARDIISQSRH